MYLDHVLYAALTCIIIIIINAFQYYRMSDELKTEELETSEVPMVCAYSLLVPYPKHAYTANLDKYRMPSPRMEERATETWQPLNK